MRKQWFSQHLGALFGQLTAAGPQVLLGVFLARTGGLEMAGHFAVLTGVAGVAFTAAQWGFRSFLVLDQLHRFPFELYFRARSVALTAATIAALGWMQAMDQLPIAIGLVVILIKWADAFIDLAFAVDQVRSGTGAAISRFSKHHAVKTSILVIAMIVALIASPVLSTNATLLAASVLAALVSAWAAFGSGARGKKTANQSRGMWELFTASWTFALAAMVCAAVTNGPRVLLSDFYSGADYGVAGAGLTSATLFGMIFYTVWVRHLPRLRQRSVTSARRYFVLETSAIAGCLVLLSASVFPALLAMIFGFELAQSGELVRDVLVAATIFYAGMNLANLYKVTAWPLMETMCYAATIIAIGVFVMPGWLHQPTLPRVMGCAGLVMMLMAMPAVLLVEKSQDEGGRA